MDPLGACYNSVCMSPHQGEETHEKPLADAKARVDDLKKRYSAPDDATNADTASSSRSIKPLSKREKPSHNDEFDAPTELTIDVLPSTNRDGEQAEARLEKMCGAVRTLLECIGEDPNREGLRETPSRYAKALLFLTRGYQSDMNTIVNNALFQECHREMVVVRDIDISSLCEHHLVPFIGKVHIGYIPSGAVIGLSKLARIAEIYARRLQVQERLTSQVADAIMETLKPLGVIVAVESRHLCMVMRGVEKASAITTTISARGSLRENTQQRDEFLGITGLRGK